MRFKKKPVEIEAVQYTGYNVKSIRGFVGAALLIKDECTNCAQPTLQIHTLEGNHDVSLWDWIIQGVHGEFYPCKEDIFEKTYEPADKSSSFRDRTPQKCDQ